jgi:hypothetical protein
MSYPFISLLGVYWGLGVYGLPAPTSFVRTDLLVQDRFETFGASEQPSIWKAPGISELHRPGISPGLLATSPEPAIYARFRDTTPSPPRAVCGADTG